MVYNNSNQKDTIMVEMGTWFNVRWEWRREWFDWKIENFTKMMEEVQDQRLNNENEDMWEWKNELSNTYTNRSTYIKLKKSTIEDEVEVFENIRSLEALLSVQPFTWRVILNKITTKDNLSKKGIMLDNKLCVMYGHEMRQ